MKHRKQMSVFLFISLSIHKGQFSDLGMITLTMSRQFVYDPCMILMLLVYIFSRMCNNFLIILCDNL